MSFNNLQDQPQLWKLHSQRIERATSKFWNERLYNDYARLQNPGVWLALQRKLNDLLKQPGVKQLKPFEEFLLRTATTLYEAGWQAPDAPRLSHKDRYFRSGQMILESVEASARDRFGLSEVDRITVGILAQLCTAVGWTTLADLSIDYEDAGYQETARLRYLVALVQAADFLLIDRANDIHLRDLDTLKPENVADARLALQPYIPSINLSNNNLTFRVRVHPNDAHFAGKMGDLFLEPIQQWLQMNGEWLAIYCNFALILNKPEPDVVYNGLPPDPIEKTCRALIPFLEAFQPTVVQITSRVQDNSGISPTGEISRAASGAQEDIGGARIPVSTREHILPVEAKAPRTRAFIGYSHKDERFLERLQVHLAYYERLGSVDAWDATRIAPGAVWRRELEKAIEAAKVAVLLISADFLASKFIAEQELPRLLAAAREGGATILPVILSPCGFEVSNLAQFQAVNRPSRPLTKMSKNEKEETWDKVARIVYNATLSDGTKTQVEESAAKVRANVAPPRDDDEASHRSTSHGKEAFRSFTFQIGQKLWDQYQILKIIGHTKHSQVVQAWDDALQREVAIKFFYLDEENNEGVTEQLRKNLLREARILVKLEHKNIGKVFTVMLAPPAPAIVMQWVEGRSLQEVLMEESAIPISQVIKIGIGLAEALIHIHAQGITHRDIKPNNIILREDAEPVLIDFDIARSKNLETITRREDGSFTYVGNPPYSAPEQFVSPESVGPPADIFALGVVLYEVLAHQLPYPWGNNPKHYNGHLPQPEKENIPEQLYSLLCKVLSQEPEQRPNALQLKEQLRAYLSTLAVDNSDY
jgi:predicted Ser/Thr protein kinase